jgi:hypothetical protein
LQLSQIIWSRFCNFPAEFWRRLPSTLSTPSKIDTLFSPQSTPFSYILHSASIFAPSPPRHQRIGICPKCESRCAKSPTGRSGFQLPVSKSTSPLRRREIIPQASTFPADNAQKGRQSSQLRHIPHHPDSYQPKSPHCVIWPTIARIAIHQLSRKSLPISNLLQRATLAAYVHSQSCFRRT